MLNGNSLNTLTVQPMYAEPFMEIFAQVFRLFPFNKFRHDGLVHALLPGNSSSHLIDGNFIRIKLPSIRWLLLLPGRSA